MRQVCGGESRAPGAARVTTLARQSSASWRCSSMRSSPHYLINRSFKQSRPISFYILILVKLFQLLWISYWVLVEFASAGHSPSPPLTPGECRPEPAGRGSPARLQHSGGAVPARGLTHRFAALATKNGSAGDKNGSNEPAAAGSAPPVHGRPPACWPP